MLKKYFDWTPRDISTWEMIRKKGLRNFVFWYGLVSFGGILFILLGGAVFVPWAKAFLENQVTISIAAIPHFTFLVLELLFVAAVCVLGGLFTSLVTWFMEEAIYRKYKSAGPDG